MATGGAAHTSNADLQPWSHLRVWLFCLGVGLVFRGYSRDPAWVEEAYVDGWGSQLASLLSAWTGGVPFSVAEILVVLLVAVHLLYLLEALAEVGAGRRGPINAVAGGLAHVGDLAAVSLVLFYAVWGISYARAPAIERLGWSELVAEEITPDTTRALFTKAWLAQDQLHLAYRALHGSDDAGVVTTPREGLDVNKAVDVGFQAAAKALALPESFAAPRGPVKQPLGSAVLSWLGIGGIYIPFTGEATVNADPPAWSQVGTFAHEKAHQRMVASEDEATFFGYLALIHSEEPLLRYAGWLTAWRQLRRSLAAADPAAVEALDLRLLAGPRRDLQDLHDHWAAYAGELEELHKAMNDQYLRANAVEGGVLAYGRVGRLVAAYLDSAPGRKRYGQALVRSAVAAQSWDASSAGAQGQE